MPLSGRHYLNYLNGGLGMIEVAEFLFG